MVLRRTPEPSISTSCIKKNNQHAILTADEAIASFFVKGTLTRTSSREFIAVDELVEVTPKSIR